MKLVIITLQLHCKYNFKPFPSHRVAGNLVVIALECLSIKIRLNNSQ